MQTATREVVVNREELGRIAGARRRELGLSVPRVADPLDIADETLRAFEQGRGHLGVQRVHHLLSILNLHDVKVETREAKSPGTGGTPVRRHNTHQLRILLAYVIKYRGQMTPGMASMCMDMEIQKVKRIASFHWFAISDRNIISLTEVGKVAIG
jgi:hypothetical protein